MHIQDGHHTAEGPQEPGDRVTERGLLPPACVSPQIQLLQLHLLHEHLHLSPVPPIEEGLLLARAKLPQLGKDTLTLSVFGVLLVFARKGLSDLISHELLTRM